MPGRRAFWTSGSQGSLGKDPGSIEFRLDRRERRRGAEPFRRLPRSRPSAPGGDCRRDAWRPARASVRLPRPLRRIRSPDAHALGSIGPARPGRGLRSRGRVQDLPGKSDLRELVMPGTASRVAARRPPSRRARRARLPSARAVRPHHTTGSMDGRVCAGATWMASRTAVGHEGYRQVGGGDRADRSARLPAPAPVIAAGTTAATVVLPGLLAPDVASGLGLQPVKGSGPG
jgi:hypothetical protein